MQKNNKGIKKLKKVLVQPYKVIWPFIGGDEFRELCSRVAKVERNCIVTGCNAVLKLLQKGEVDALFIEQSFSPRSFANFIIQMARRRNPSAAIVAVPSLPITIPTTNMLMAIVRPKEEEQSSVIRGTVDWLKEVLLKHHYITPTDERSTPALKQCMKSKKSKPPEKPLTEQDIAKLYVLEPVSGDGERNREDHFKSTDFLSFSDKDKSHTIKMNQPEAGQVSFKPLIDRKAAYKPLKVNTIQANPNRAESKKQKKKKMKQNQQKSAKK